MFWSALSGADQQEDFSDQHWSELEILLPQPFWLESNSAMAPLRVTQRWSALIRVLSSDQCHSALNHWNQFSCWVTLIRTEWHWTELDFTCCYYINNKKKCRSKDWTIAFTYITWPTLTILPLSHTVFIRHTVIHPWMIHHPHLIHFCILYSFPKSSPFFFK